MKRYVFENATGTLRVEFAVDNFGGQFTVNEIRGLSDAEKTFGIDFQQLAYHHSTFVAFAQANNLKLSQQTQDDNTTVVAVGTAISISNSATLAAGICGTAEISSITCVADVANNLNGKYFLISSPTVDYYVWYKTSGGAASDPAVASRTGIQVNVATGATNTAVATATAAALDALAAFSAPAPGAAIVLATNEVKGAATNAGAGNSGFTVSTSTGGTDATAYSVTITAAGGNSPYTYAVTTGTLPAGLTLTSAGVLAGTPTAVAVTAFTITGTDLFGQTIAKAFSITVTAT